MIVTWTSTTTFGCLSAIGWSLTQGKQASKSGSQLMRSREAEHLLSDAAPSGDYT